MRILHTSDWHLSDRLYWIDRQPDIRQRLNELAGYLDEEQIDVMVVAGDLFSQRNSRMEELQVAVQDVNKAFAPFLERGGTIVAISGNHDNEHLFGLLRATQELSAPMLLDKHTDCYPSGRMYLATRMTLLPLRDGNGERVQFVLVPYPTSHRYLKSEVSFTSVEDKHRLLHGAVLQQLAQLREESLDRRLASVLVGHLHVRGSELHTLYKLSEQDDVIFDLADLPMDWAYSAFGHIHKAQRIGGGENVRYSGSIERMDVGERDDDKSAVVVEIRNGVRTGSPRTVPLSATPIYQIEIKDPDRDLQKLEKKFPRAKESIAYCTVHYKPGTHNVREIINTLESRFRALCKVDVIPEGVAPSSPTEVRLAEAESVPEKVRSYLQQRLIDDPDRAELLALTDLLLEGRP